MMTNGTRRLASAAAVAATVAAAGLMAAAPAHADTIAASTTCSNPYTGSQAGPSSSTSRSRRPPWSAIRWT